MAVLKRLVDLLLLRGLRPPRHLIDAHVHVATAHLIRRLVEGPPVPEVPIEADAGLLLEEMQRGRVTASLVVIVPEDAAALLRIARGHPGRLLGLLWFDSRRPQESVRALDRLFAEHPGELVGAKTALPYLHQDPLQRDLFPLYDLCSERDLPLQFHMGGDPAMEETCRPAHFAKLAELFPNLKIVCLHAGGGFYREMPRLLAGHPNIWLQVEGLQLAEAEGDRRPRVLRYLLQTWGSERVLFGTDRIAHEPKYLDRIRVVARLPGRHRERLCWQNAARLYGLPLSYPPAGGR